MPIWNFCNPIDSDALKLFEDHFDFHIAPPLRDFLLNHNGGKTRHCSLPTHVRERRIESLLDFSKEESAWAINRRMRRLLGEKFIVIGTDRTGNLLCVRRNMRKQEFVVWNHITNNLEDCVLDIPIVLMYWQNEERS